MKKIIITVTAIVMSISLFAQNNIEDVLTAVEQNNKSLKALRDLTESQKLENKTGIFLDDPEIGFNYLCGHPSEVGQRHDITVTQSFAFSTILG